MLEAIFHELNHAHFGSALPPPKLSWNSRLSSTAGRFCPGSRIPLRRISAEIEVATYLRDLPDGTIHVRDTVLHEMIHYFLWHQRKPHGHTAEFHDIMKRVGAKRYNTVPQLRPIKHWYECPVCRIEVPARRKLGISACAPCCEKHNRGRYHDRFRLRIRGRGEKGPETKVPSPVLVPDERPLSPAEIIGRLEELKLLLKKKIP
ncbi:MAG TPA: SprT-like domain-containing protein [Bdellovibrionota bacterium]